MKVAVVSTPRTCSSFLCEVMKSGFGVHNYSEIFSHSQELPESVDNATRIKILEDNDDYVAKITSTTFILSNSQVTVEGFPWHTFDKIVMIERKDIVRQCASWHFLTVANRNGVWSSQGLKGFYQKTLEDPSLLTLNYHDNEYMLNDILHFHRVLVPHINGLGHPDVRMVNYEFFQQPVDEYWEEANRLMGVDFPKSVYERSGNKSEVDYTAFIEHYRYDEVIRQMIDLTTHGQDL